MNSLSLVLLLFFPARSRSQSAPSGGAAMADPATEQALADVGAQQMAESVKKDEDQMLKNGVYKKIQRTPDGRGAVITLADGSVTWSDYRQGFCTMPQKSLSALAQAMMRGGGDPAAVSDVKKIEIASADKPTPKAADSSGKNAAAVALKNAASPESAPPSVAAAQAPATPSPENLAQSPETQSPASSANSGTDAYLLGQALGRSGLALGSGQSASQPAPAVVNAPPPQAPGPLDPGRFQFLRVRRAAQGRALEQLSREAANPADAPDASLPAGQERRGFGATTN